MILDMLARNNRSNSIHHRQEQNMLTNQL